MEGRIDHDKIEKYSTWSRSSVDPAKQDMPTYECCINKNKDEVNQLPHVMQ